MKEIDITPKAETIVILGAPGSGKDTQVEFLMEALGYQEISSGELVRLRAQHDEELRKITESGGLAPNDVIDDEIISVFALLPDEQPVILNGYPRTLEQAKKLPKILAENNRKLDKVIYIRVPDNDLATRIGKRRVCAKCGHFTDDSHESCPECNSSLKLREDDKPESVKKRLELFHKETEPVIQHFKKEYNFCEVDGKPAIEKVRENIRKIM
jgi:adenylate kinase